MTRVGNSGVDLRALPTLTIADPGGYERLKERIRTLVAGHVPPGRMLVASKGDDELLALHDRRGEHFPRDDAGRFTSAHPADGREAVVQLDALVAAGARHLLVPATSFWWFAHYGELTDRLEAGAEVVAVEEETCAVLDLRGAFGARLAGAPARTRPRVLFLCHNHPDVRPAGAENYALEVHRAMACDGRYEPTFVARTGPPMAAPLAPGGPPVTAVAGRPDELLLSTDPGDWDVLLGTMRDKRLYTGVLRELLADVDPDVVHVQHSYLLGHDVLREIRTTLPGVPIVHTLHELLPICHNRGQMVRTRGTELCDRASPQRCHECFPGVAPERFLLRTRFIQAQLSLVDRFVCPSRFLAQRFVEWGLPAERVLVEEYGRTAGGTVAAAPERTPPVRIGFFGQLSPFKGVDVLLEAALLLQRAGSPARFVLHGAHLELQDEAFRTRFAELLDAAEPSVRLHGAYRPEELDALMADVDWVVVPSVWWENSPLVIQEAFQRGRPVICSDIGGMAEKVDDGVNGLHARAGNAEDLAATIERAIAETGLWSRLRDGVPGVYPMDRHLDWLADLYDGLRAGRPAPAEAVHA